MKEQLNDLNLSLSVWRDVDILVLGATTAAVAAALEIAGQGKSVALVSDEPYLGQDLAGTFHLWEEDTPDPLVSAAFASCVERPARPAALKRYLEQELLKAGIPFLFGARPVGLLRDESGRLRGAALAARTSLFAATCREIVDATPFGLAARLAGVTLAPRTAAEDEIRWRVLASRPPVNWPGCIRPHYSPYRQILKDGPVEYPAFELAIDRHRLTADARELEHAARAHLIDENVWVAADHLLDAGTEMLPTREIAKSLDDLAESQFHAADGVWIANRLLASFDPRDVTNPNRMAAVGRRVGCLAAAKQGRPIASNRAALHFQSAGNHPGVFEFTQVFFRGNRLTVQTSLPEFPDAGEFDVIVAGGGTGGAPAAIAAARAGAKTLCLEAAHGLGGVGTIGLISSYWFGNKCGFTSELDELVSEVDSLSRAKNGNAWHPGVKSGMYHRLLREAGGTAWMGSFVFGVRRRGNRPDGALVSTPYGCGFISAKTFVDATGNADLAAAAGAPCRMMDARHAAVQGTGISPRVHPSVPHQNSDHTFIEENDPEGITGAHVQAREKYPNDFETQPFINSRERRQILGDIEISPLDILAGRTFPDTIFTARSNFDTHGFIIHPVFMVVPPDHKPMQAHVPLRCMLPQGIEGVIVTGLGMSAHRDALPVIRMQADVQNQGFAAGCLAAQCALDGSAIRSVDPKTFQRRLVEHGIITRETAQHGDSFPLPPSAIAEAIRGRLDNPKDVAVLFAHPEISRTELIRILQERGEEERRRKAALILGLMGCPEAAPFLSAFIAQEPWDEGWNYRGMGQFGASMSRLDAMIIALGKTGDAQAFPVLEHLASELDADAAFSHCRALALAAACLRAPELGIALRRLLDLPGFSGHAFLRVEQLLADADDNPTATTSRNLALRELYVARGLFLTGDSDNRGRDILETYAQDLRGHFARHALAVLAADNDALPPRELA